MTITERMIAYKNRDGVVRPIKWLVDSLNSLPDEQLKIGEQQVYRWLRGDNIPSPAFNETLTRRMDKLERDI